MAQTNTDPPALTVPSGTEVYDSLMSAIDPDLLTANVPLLDEKYRSETPQERALRYQRYKESYAKYDAAFAVWLSSLQTAVTVYRHEALHAAEQEDKESDAQKLSTIESNFTSAA